MFCPPSSVRSVNSERCGLRNELRSDRWGRGELASLPLRPNITHYTAVILSCTSAFVYRCGLHLIDHQIITVIRFYCHSVILKRRQDANNNTQPNAHDIRTRTCVAPAECSAAAPSTHNSSVRVDLRAVREPPVHRQATGVAVRPSKRTPKTARKS